MATDEAGGATDEELRALFDAVSNWRRWGDDDVRGTLNTITPDVVRRASGLVRSARTVSCSRPVGFRRITMPTDNVLHLMTKTGGDSPAQGEGAATDWVGFGLHGISFTHIDAHSHVFWDGRMYNGRDKDLVTAERGALTGGLEPVFDGVVSRGILLDIPVLLGIEAMAPGQALEPDDLTRAFDRFGVSPEAGDILFIRTGYSEQPVPVDGRPTAGLTARCVPLLREADVAVMVSDGVHDVSPSGYADVVSPVHVLTLVAMGMWLVDNARLGPLADVCRQEGRYEFMAVLAPIPFRRATGSLLNPIAMF